MRIKSCIPSTEREYCEADVLHREEIVALNSHVQNFPRHVCIGNGALLIYYCDCDMHMPVGPDGLNVMAVMARMREKRWRDECQLQEPKKVGSRCRGPSSSWHFKEKIPAHTTQWFKYIEEGLWSDAAHAQGKLFRRRFRVPWSFYKAIVKHVGEDENFSELMPGPDALGRPPTLLDLKVLGVLRVLGRYVTFDDIEELNGISAETNRKFFHDFVRLYSTHVYPIAVRWPDPDETRDILETARRAGFPGKIGSMDCVHFTHDGMAANLKVAASKGGSSGPKTVAYCVVVRHDRRVLDVSRGVLGATNDKNIVGYNSLAMAIHRGTAYYGEFEFQLCGADGVMRTFTKLWIMVDNGFQRVPSFQGPLKWVMTDREGAFSKAAESSRKDSECTFGSVKGRFRVLKTGIRVHSLGVVEHIVRTCFAMHNQLLHLDGFDMSWLGDDGLFAGDSDDDDDSDALDPKKAFPRLSLLEVPVDAHTDLSGRGTGDARGDALREVAARRRNDGEALTHRAFQQALITHYHYKNERGETEWMQRPAQLVRGNVARIFQHF